ncbi:Kinesin-like protein NACK1 [Hibiscus syriacus]|uniref:Kinesin-like protein NACK1 n=1 Tax=Hibiscus syriacus TaxID=106335 RepID=A0A6A2ZRQ5_HIBSY|nr:Kinesin-like protein NACK1 [Hibiscus syriacus]
MTVRTPGTPARKIDRTPVTPGGPKSMEEKIVVTVRLRPVSKREQLAKDQVAWDCVDEYTIVSKHPSQERTAQPPSFTFGLEIYNENVRDLLNSESGRNLNLLDDPETIQSTLCENSDCVRSFVASLKSRLRFHLTTPILSNVGKRSGHIPYGDSKLTRILQHSLGGNARTAIICTLSPAQSHFEQSRNTLFFATRAKEVTNNAQVNMVVSNKQLVKHLQKEVARLEAELRTPDLYREKDFKIQQMEMDIEQLKRQRDLAQFQVDELRKKLQEQQQTSNPIELPHPSVKKCLSYSDVLSPKLEGKELSHNDKSRKTLLRQSMRQSSTAPFTLMHEIRNQDAAVTIAKLQAEIREMCAVGSIKKEIEVGTGIAPNKSISANLKEEITRLHLQGSTIANLEEQLENVQKAPEDGDIVSKETLPESEKGTPAKSEQVGDVSSKEGTPPGYRRSSSVNMKKMQKMFQNAAEENVRSIRAYVTELKERVAKLQYQKHLLVCQVLELEANEAAGQNLEDDKSAIEPEEPQVPWHVTFREQRQHIIEEDPADQIYMEVELRRLNWMQNHFAELGNASPALVGDECAVSLSSSIRALKREKEFLAKRLTLRLSAERDALYIKWNVPLVRKQRRLQFINKLWTDPHDAKNIEDSAQIVAKLVGFSEGGNMSREMFELNFAFPADKSPWMVG